MGKGGEGREGCQSWLVLRSSETRALADAHRWRAMRIGISSLASCIACEGRAVWAVVQSAKKRACDFYHTEFVQRSLSILCNACGRAVEKLYFSAGALTGIIEGLWRALRWAQATESAATASWEKVAMSPCGFVPLLFEHESATRPAPACMVSWYRVPHGVMTACGPSHADHAP